jgi:adenylate cyclase
LLRGDALDARERRAVHRQPTGMETYENFLRGRQRMHAWGEQPFAEAVGFYERAIALDAEYAPAWAGLATVHCLLYEWCGSRASDLEAADRASRIAMQLAPGLADARLARGYTLSNLRRYAEAVEHFEAAILINPNLFDAWYYFGRAAFAAGEIKRSIEVWERGAEVRRDDFECAHLAAQSLRLLGRHHESLALYRESLRRSERLLEVNPRNARVLSLGAGALVAVGQGERALEWARRAEQINPDDMGVIINGALVRTQLGMKDEALDMLETVFGKGWGKREWIEHDTDYDPLRNEPRFQAMLARLK